MKEKDDMSLGSTGPQSSDEGAPVAATCPETDTELGDLIADIKSMINEVLIESLADPDLVAQSQDFRAGYERGFREAIVATLPFLAKKRADIGS